MLADRWPESSAAAVDRRQERVGIMTHLVIVAVAGEGHNVEPVLVQFGFPSKIYVGAIDYAAPLFEVD